MKSKKVTNMLISAAAATAMITVAAQTAKAVPIFGLFVEDPRCDTLPQQFLSHELGDAAVFPINEALQIAVAPVTFTVCVPNDNIQNDWVVRITNVSNQAWGNLFFVADHGATVGNADGSVFDLTNAAIPPEDAFRIDGTVTPGVNNNLLAESGLVDEILSPGETWAFAVSNFGNTLGLAPFPPIFQTPGVFAGTSPISTLSTASILATPVPEPTTIGALGLVAALCLMRRRPRHA